MPFAPPPDPEVPALEVLLGPAAAEVLDAALAPAGSRVEELRPSQVRYVPGNAVTVQYRVKISNGAGVGSSAVLVAASGMEIPEGPAIVESGELRIAVWRFPHDPFLPGLGPASDPVRTAQLLTRLGAPTEKVQIRTRAYRAGRRAVIQATSEQGTIFIKVLRPRRIAELQRKHVNLVPHLPIPHSLGWSRELGIVAMQALGGVTLRQSLESGAAAQPSPQALDALLDQFPEPRPDAGPVAGAFERAPVHARLLGTVLPEAQERLAALVAGVAEAANDDPLVAVHGDFHSSQILIDEGRIVGLVDIDTAGIGQRANDLAGLLGQLSTVATVSRNPAPIDGFRGLLLEDFSKRTDPASLRRRVAGAIVGLATGPFRVQLPDWPEATLRRLELAERWLESAVSGKNPINP